MINNLLAPVGHDRDGPMFSAHKLALTIVNDIRAESYFTGRAKMLSKDLEEAEQRINQSTQAVSNALEKMVSQERKFSEATKKVSGQVRDATHKLADGLARVEKTANFDRLSQYAELLGRIEKSLSVLAELEKQGLLEKVGKALQQ